MPLLQKSMRMVGPRLPKLLSPKAHAVADYSTAAVFFIAAALFWKENKRAAIASLICGSAEAAVASLTDYPGGIKKAIDFRLHREIDFGLSNMTAVISEYLEFEKDREKAFFRMQSLVIAGAAAVTDFDRGAEFRQKDKVA